MVVRQQPRGARTALTEEGVPARLGLVGHFLRDEPLPVARSLATLRAVYVLSFMAQVAIAVVVATAVRWLAGGTPRPSDVLAWVLVALALMQLPLVALTASRLGAVASRQAALSRTLFTAMVLAATAWFAALALATGQRGPSVYLLLSLVLLSYALGFLVVSRLAGRAASLPPLAPAGAAKAAGSGDGGEPERSAFEARVLEDVDHVEGLGGA